MTQALYIETANEELELREQEERRLNVSGVLRILGVSRSGYNSWKKRLPSDSKQRKNTLKVKIKEIYDESKQNYGAPKIASILNQNGEHIAEKLSEIICVKWESRHNG